MHPSEIFHSTSESASDADGRTHICERVEARDDAGEAASPGKNRLLAISRELGQSLQALSLLNGALRRMSADPIAAEALAQQVAVIGTLTRLVRELADVTTLEPRPSSHAAAHSRPGAGCHILLVEDDAGVRDATRMLLAAEGFSVTTAASHEEALRKACESPAIDLVVSDYHLSGEETGLHVISSLRARFGERLKAILITGDTSSNVKQTPLDSRLRLASKPLHAERLLLLIGELLAV
jgi:CheY-like chemotaxis protein